MHDLVKTCFCFPMTEHFSKYLFFWHQSKHNCFFLWISISVFSGIVSSYKSIKSCLDSSWTPKTRAFFIGQNLVHFCERDFTKPMMNQPLKKNAEENDLFIVSIRDPIHHFCRFAIPRILGKSFWRVKRAQGWQSQTAVSVSYTHLTLPTKA